MKNDAKCLNIIEILDNKNYWADKFCENNKTLKELLLFCWGNSISTVSCCIGHEKEDAPFIVFEYNKTNLKKIGNLIDKCLKKEDIYISITKGTSFVNNICITSDNTNPDIFFKFILSNIKEANNIINSLYLIINECLINYGTAEEGYHIFVQKTKQKWQVKFKAYTDVEMDGIQLFLHDFLIKNEFKQGKKFWSLIKEFNKLTDLEDLLNQLNKTLIDLK